MVGEYQVVSFENGSARLLDGKNPSREVVLALPLRRLILKMIRVPAAEIERATEFAAAILETYNPYPDEPLTVTLETVRESPGGRVVIAAALPESATEDVAAKLDEMKLNVTRIDALELGAIRGVLNSIATAEDGARRLVVFKTAEGFTVFALDGGEPSAIRAIDLTADIRREITLLLLEAEDFGGAKPLVEIVAIGDCPGQELESFAPLRTIEVGEDVALVGVAERSAEPGALNALPASWGEVLAESRFKGKWIRRLAIALGIWVLLVGVDFGVPIAYSFMTDNQKELSRGHQRRYRAVAETRDKVNLVRKYSDHSRGALEIMKALSDRLPGGIVLSSWNFRRDEGVTVSGEADDATAVYAFKENMAEIGIFDEINLKGPSAGRNGKQRFDLECLYASEEEAE